MQAECLSFLLRGLSYGMNPGAARALQIVRLIHDMFFAAPRTFQPCASDPPVSISSQDANEARAKGFSEAKTLFEECAAIITNTRDHEEECAWDESQIGDYNNMATWPGAPRHEKVQYPTGRFANSNNYRGPPAEVLESARSAPPGLGANGLRPPIRASGRGPPPSVHQNGGHVPSRGRGPPPGIAHRPQGPNSFRSHPRAPPGIVSSESANGPHHYRPQQTASRSSNPTFSSSDSMDNFSPHARGLKNETYQDDESWNVQRRPVGLPGQPPLGSVQPQYSEYQGLSGGYGSIHGQQTQTLRPPQPPMPMPGLRGRPSRGRGPPPGSGYRMARRVPPSDDSWAFGVDADVPLPQRLYGDHAQSAQMHRNERNSSVYSGQYYATAMDGGDDDMDSEFWTAWTPNDAENAG